MVSDKPTITDNAIYSRREAAQALGVSLSTLKKLIDEGYLEVSRPARNEADIYQRVERTDYAR